MAFVEVDYIRCTAFILRYRTAWSLDVDVGSHDICAVSLLSVSFGETA